MAGGDGSDEGRSRFPTKALMLGGHVGGLVANVLQVAGMCLGSPFSVGFGGEPSPPEKGKKNP